MNDMRATIAAKSDQLNADDLIGTTRTIKISKVLISASAEQPVAIHYEGDNGKPYMCCKSMRRVMVNIWGPDANAYIGRSMTLYRDPNVRFGGLAVGGIRISHMSGISEPVTMALTETRASRKPFTVKPLAVTATEPRRQTAREFLTDLDAELGRAMSPEAVEEIVAREVVQKALGAFPNGALEQLNGMIKAARDRTAPPQDDDGFPGDPE